MDVNLVGIGDDSEPLSFLFGEFESGSGEIDSIIIVKEELQKRIKLTTSSRITEAMFSLTS
jgi:hypothetical protein